MHITNSRLQWYHTTRNKELAVIFVLVVCPIMLVQAKFQICTISVPDVLETCQFHPKD
ncbi:hypothetical protein Hanom_Chr01g00064081 [Helianthus anomalus]